MEDRQSHLWTSSYPREGWHEVDVVDTGVFPGGECNFCGTEYRYEHVLTHSSIKTGLYVRVGVVCAEKLTEDYVNPRKREKRLEKKQRWLRSPKWRRTEGANLYRADDGVLVYKKNLVWKLKIYEKWGKNNYKNIEQAKEAAFNYLYPLYIF